MKNIDADNRLAASIRQAPCSTGDRPLYPVVLSVPAHLQHLRGRPKVAILSRLARVAVRLSARLAGIEPPTFAKDQQGVPLPSAGVYWSLTHKSAFVAGVAAAAAVGIDIEQVRSPSKGLWRRIAAVPEWRLSRGRAGPDLFYRVWTAKEAVLKAESVGLRALSRCKITAVPNRHHMRLAFDRRRWTVAHYYLDDHVVALTRRRGNIRWRVDPSWLIRVGRSGPDAQERR